MIPFKVRFETHPKRNHRECDERLRERSTYSSFLLNSVRALRKTKRNIKTNDVLRAYWKTIFKTYILKEKPCRYSIIPVCAYSSYSSSFFFREIEQTKRFSVNSFMLTADDRLTCCDTHIYIYIIFCMCMRSANHFFSSCIHRLWYFTTHTLTTLRIVSTDYIQTWIRSLG